jgi:putative tryptophan/tyrosine transport system substrate-binding protein
MRRREFIAGLGGAAAWPLAAHAQQPAMPVIGYLTSGMLPNVNTLDAFRKGLGEMGYVEGRNVAFDIRTTEQYDQLPMLAAGLVRRRVAVIYTGGTVNSTLAAKAATATIPIVFQIGADPIRFGLVASINRPGGNITGVSNYSTVVETKRLELLRELVPKATLIGFLSNPATLGSDYYAAELQAAARGAGQETIVLSASDASEIDTALATAAQRRVSALMVGADGLYVDRRDQLIALAARYGIPAIYTTRESVEAGGLMSYGDDRFETRRQSGIYVGRILKGEKPADLPVLQPAKFELVINRRTAKALGLTVPLTLLAIADRVIE